MNVYEWLLLLASRWHLSGSLSHQCVSEGLNGRMMTCVVRRVKSGKKSYLDTIRHFHFNCTVVARYCRNKSFSSVWMIRNVVINTNLLPDKVQHRAFLPSGLFFWPLTVTFRVRKLERASESWKPIMCNMSVNVCLIQQLYSLKSEIGTLYL